MRVMYRRAREAANLSFFAADAVHRVRRYGRRRQGESHILRVVNLVDGIRLGMVAVKVSLGRLRVRRWCYPEGERTAVAGRDTLRHAIHEQFSFPARRNVERKLLQVQRKRAAVVQLCQQQERLPCCDDCRQYITIGGGKGLRHGTPVWCARTYAEVDAQCQIGGLLKLFLLGAQGSKQVGFLRSRQVRLLKFADQRSRQVQTDRKSTRLNS